MKQASPVHSVAGFLDVIALDAQRMRRETERRGTLRMQLHRFDMPALERAKRNRTAVRAHGGAIRGGLVRAFNW